MGVVRKKNSIKMRGGTKENGVYRFGDKYSICFFSDIEGNMPDGIRELMFDTGKTGDTPKTLVNEVIVFTGDLIDRGEYTIRNLQRMLALKEANPENVILICGNRDVNKIRMYHECHIQEIEDKILNCVKDKDKDFDAILGILQGIPDDTSIFTNKLDTIKEIIDIKGINGIGDDRPDFSVKYSDDISRITKMYSNTLGSPKQIELFKAEFEVLFRIKEDYWKDKENTLLKFIAMMNMVMGKVWDERALPAILVPYNGLYIKYLQECHIMASITIGTKLCIVSHAGIPYNETQGFYIPTEIGIVPTPTTIEKTTKQYGELITTQTQRRNNPHYYKISNIESLNNDFTTFIEGIKGGFIIDKKKYKRYVAMSANCDDTVAPYTAYASPIVSQKDFDEVKSKMSLDLDKFKTEKIIRVYNIFGHQPSGLLPYISRGGSTYSYHIDLDISRAEDLNISNKVSYTYLKITDTEDMLFGRTDTNNTYHSITDKNEDEKEVKDLSKQDIKIVKRNIVIDYSTNISLDEYCNKVLQATYITNYQITNTKLVFTSNLFTVDNKKYYGMFSWTLVEYTKESIGGGRGKIKIYTKSIKRFMYGKRNMVIYVGKRGGEYVKVKGEYVSLAKFRLKKV
jgi:hypothetical protein